MFEKVDIHSLSFNPFDKIGKDWLLISATKNGKTNTMTASWGTLGHLWNKLVTYGIRMLRSSLFVHKDTQKNSLMKVIRSPYLSLMISTKNYLT